MRRLLFLLIASLVMGCSKSVPPSPAPDSIAASHDKSAADSLAEKEKCFPALDWLKDTAKHSLWKGDRAAIVTHFVAQRTAGAKEIYAVDVEETEGQQICASFVLVLPEGAARKAVLDKHNAFWKSYLGPQAGAEELKEFVVGDEGQKYLVYNFDL
ncbi:hypothetical protein IV102_11210 [bacterium]|nr:hypothetical protein [bacterium]